MTNKKIIIDGYFIEILKEKNNIRLLRENLESKSYKKPKYQYYIQYKNEKWESPEPKISYSRAKDEFEYQSRF